MLLSDYDIHKGIAEQMFWIKPFDSKRVQPASYDVSLSNVFRVFIRGHHTFIDPTRKQEGLTRLVEIPEGERFILHPTEFVLGMTEETIGFSNMAAGRIEGKSSLGRTGLVIHSTAGWLDPGFSGRITLELSNVAPLPIVLTPGMLIGQISFMRLLSGSTRLYGDPELGSRYQGHVEPTESKFHERRECD